MTAVEQWGAKLIGYLDEHRLMERSISSISGTFSVTGQGHPAR